LPEDTTLIVSESGIDVLSYHALHRPAYAHYVSIAGEMNPMQKILLASAMQKLPRGGTVIAATDNDPGGVNLARKIREITEDAVRQDLGVVDHRPGQPADPRPTWNPDKTLHDNDQYVKAVLGYKILTAVTRKF
jgi:hypothetical protein